MRFSAPAALTAAGNQLGRELAAERDTLLDRTCALLQLPRVAQAVTQSAPGFAQRLYRSNGPLVNPAKRRRKDQAELLTGHRFLHRLGTRCETVSFYGPSLFVRIDSDAPEPVSVAGTVPERVAVDASAWVVRTLAERARHRLPKAEWWVGRDPMWRAEPGRLVRVPDDRELPLTEDGARLWQAMDRWRRLGDALTADGLTPAAGRRALRELRAALRFGPVVPATERRALAWLAQRTPADPEVRSLLNRLREAESMPWPQRMVPLAAADRDLREAGLETARGQGEQYADRSFWHEERSSPYSERVTFGAPTTAGVHRALGVLLPLLYLVAVLERADARRAVRAALGGRPVNLAVAATLDISAVTPRADALRTALVDLARARGTAGIVVRLDAEQLQRVCAPFWAELTEADLTPAPALPGFDLLAAGTRLERARWVLGEVHDDSSSILGGSSGRVHSDPDGLYARFCTEVAGVVAELRLACLLGPEWGTDG